MLEKNGFRILHTSDWHLGNTLKDKDRTLEFEGFLNWLLDILSEEQVDALVVAGDIFDVANPSHRIQELYYRFLATLASSNCKNVVIVAGNHDSGLLLDAPKALLSAISVHVVGNVRKDDLANQNIELKEGDEVKMIVCAVPYLREAALRYAAPENTDRDISKLVIEGTKAHYHAVYDLALLKRKELGREDIPIIATGHLFAANVSGGRDEGVRDVVGNLGLIGLDTFPEGLDYIALGHIHRAQKIGGLNKVRYSGAPLLMGFDEIGKKRLVHIVDFPKGEPCLVRDIEVPVFQEFKRIQGDILEIKKEMALLKQEKSKAFVEVIYDGKDFVGNLSHQLRDEMEEVCFTVVRLVNKNASSLGAYMDEELKNLSEMHEEEVFLKLLKIKEIEDEQVEELLGAFREIIVNCNEEEAI